MQCKEGICMNEEHNINCCIHCENKCDSPCERDPETCGKYIEPISKLKKNIKCLLENNAVHTVAFNDIDRGELTLHLFGNNSITIVPIIVDGEPKLKIETTYIKKEEGIL